MNDTHSHAIAPHTRRHVRLVTAATALTMVAAVVAAFVGLAG
jgi:hypothetical protein